MSQYSVLVPFQPRRPEQILPYAGFVAWTRAHRLWQGQSLTADAGQSFAFAAGAGFRIPVGLGVALMGLRHPFEAALQARSLAMLHGRDVIAGFGPGGRSFQQAVRAEAYPSALTVAREYLTVARQALRRQPSEFTGQYFTLRAQLPPAPAPQVQLGLGVLRPGMAGLAGEVADVAITWLTPPHYLKDVIAPALAEGARAAQRSRPRLVAIVPVALQASDRDPVALALASNRAHLMAPHYRAMLRLAGAGVEEEHDLEAAAKALVACDGFVYATPDRLAESLRSYADAGVDEIVLNLTGVFTLYGQQAVMTELASIIEVAP